MFEERKLRPLRTLKRALDYIRVEIRHLTDYINDISEALYQKQTELQKEYVKELQANPGDDMVEISFGDEFRRYHELFPTFSFNSILVSQISFFENRLKHICELYQSRHFAKVKPSDLFGSDIEKCRKYILHVAGIQLDDLGDQWKKITDVQKLRNAIVHNNAGIANTKENSNILSFIKSEKRIMYDEEYEQFYISEASFLKDFNTLILDFFTKLVEKLSSAGVVARNTVMPDNNDKWGQERIESILESGVRILEVVQNKIADKTIKQELLNHLSPLFSETTKVYSFFCDVIYSSEDETQIMKLGKLGLDRLKEMYKYDPDSLEGKLELVE